MCPASALLLTPAMPADRGNGLAMRAGLWLEGLARAFAVDVLAVPVFGGVAAPGELVRTRARSVRTLALDPAPDHVAELIRRLQTPAGRARARALHPLPSLCAAATTPATETVAEHARESALVVVLRSYLAPYLDALLDADARPRVVIDVDDVESIAQRQLGHPDEAERFERVESHYLPLADHVTTCSEADARELRERLGLDAVTAVPNAVTLPADPPPPTGELDLLFVGNLGYAPNAEAACWLCETVLPLLGDVRVAIVGSHPAPAVRALAADPRVTVAADVEDVAAWYAAASVAVVPVWRGGGSAIKLIEAFAHGRPVVATPAGARGLQWPDPGAPVVLADTPEQFARACRALLDDPARARRLAAAGEALVRAHASIDVVAPRIAELMRSVLAPGAVGAPR